VVPWLREWEHVPDGWARLRTEPAIEGWNVATVRDAYEAKLPAFRRAIEGTGPLDMPTSPAIPTSWASQREQTAILAYGYALALASRGTGRVSILDWGGGAGAFYHLSRALLPPDVEIDYHCKDVPVVCAHGRQELPEASFHEDESCLERRYDLVLASSSLQYSEDWQRVAGRLAGATRHYLFLTRVPVVRRVPSFVVRQRVRAYGLKTAYLSWVFNQGELVGATERAGMELVREFVIGFRAAVRGAPEQDETRAFLFRPAAR
jgi:putative methyltransferase (TIGR04325 family)